MEERKNVYLSLHNSFVREGIERAEHARQASRAAEHEAPRAQRSVER